MNSTLFTLLSSVSTIGEVRRSIIGLSDKVLPVFMMIAGCFLVIYLVKIAHDLMSDEQNGGIGGVSFKELIRPFIIFFLIQVSPTAMLAFDDGIMTINSAIMNEIQEDKAAALLAQTILSADEEIIKLKQFQEELKNGKALDYYAKNNNLTKEEKDYLSKTKTGVAGWLQDISKESDEAMELRRDYRNWLKTTKSAVSKWLSRLQREKNQPEIGALGQAAGIGAFTGALGTWFMTKGTAAGIAAAGILTALMLAPSTWIALAPLVFSFCYNMMVIFSNISLAVLGFMFPFTAALSILPQFKNGLLTVISAYVQISFWGVVITLIRFIASTSVANILSNNIAKAQSTVDIIIKGENATSSNSGSLWNVVLIYIAAICCIFFVPKLCSIIIPNGQGADQLNTGQSSLSKSTTGIGKVVTFMTKK